MSTSNKTGSDETTTVTLTVEPPAAVADIIYAALAAGANIEPAETLSELGQMKVVFGKHDEAEALYRASLAIAAKVVGRDHPLVKLTTKRLAGLLRITGREEQADALTRPGAAARSTTSGGVKKDSTSN